MQALAVVAALFDRWISRCPACPPCPALSCPPLSVALTCTGAAGTGDIISCDQSFAWLEWLIPALIGGAVTCFAFAVVHDVELASSEGTWILPPAFDSSAPQLSCRVSHVEEPLHSVHL